jgi:hypothetical protein
LYIDKLKVQEIGANRSLEYSKIKLEYFGKIMHLNFKNMFAIIQTQANFHHLELPHIYFWYFR